MVVKTVFMFSGQGSQYYQMGKQLFDDHPVFRAWMIRLDERAYAISGQRVVDAIYGSSKAETFDRTLLSHPAIFMVEYALAQCLQSEGIEPDLTLGASLGSFAAAAVSGLIAVDDALALVLAQARAFEDACGRGGMLAILADPALYDEAFLKTRSTMAGVNFNGHFAVSAPDAELDAIVLELKQRSLNHQRLAVSFAYHSSGIDAARAPFSAALRAVVPRRARVPMVCCEQGRTLDALPEDYFWHVVRQPIRFQEAVAHLESHGHYRYIDVGPSGTLATFLKYGLGPTSASRIHPILTPYGRDQKNLDALLDAQ